MSIVLTVDLGWNEIERISETRSIDSCRAEWRKGHTGRGEGVGGFCLLGAVVRESKKESAWVDAGACVPCVDEFYGFRGSLFERESLLVIHRLGGGGGG